jgi:sec-independent protein translocase protein TatC
VKVKKSKGQPVDARMPLTEHLAELRSRLIKSLLACAAGFALAFAFVERLFELLKAPLLRAGHPEVTLIGTGVTEAFFTQLKVSLIAGIFIASPVVLWQLWQFVAPGLYEHEKRYTKAFVFFGTLFFLLGAAFCYLVVFQAGYGFFLARYEALGVRPAIRIGEYLSFSARLLLAFGVCFELPVVAYFLTRVGLIDHRTMIRQFPYAVVLVFILAAVLTPPDLVSQILLALPMLLLYGVGIGVSYLARSA